MSSVFVQPLPFVDAGSPAPVAGSVANLANDFPGLVWQGSTSSYIIVDLGTSGATYDYVAIVGANLRAKDTVQIQSGTSTSGTGAYSGTALPAFSGPKTAVSSTMAVFKLTSARSERYVRIDFSAPNHPAGYVTAFRLVIGQSIVSMTPDYDDTEMVMEDQSIITTGPGYVASDVYAVFRSWKFSIGWITELNWRTYYAPMFSAVGSHAGVLFIVDDSHPEYYQTDSIYGRITTKASGKVESYNGWRIDGTIIAYAA